MIKGKPYEIYPLVPTDQQEYAWGSHSIRPNTFWHLHKRFKFTAICGSYTNNLFHAAQYHDVNVLPQENICEECLACWALLQFEGY